jgi:hypothetical protein
MDDDEFLYYVQQLHAADADHAYFALLTDTTEANVSKLIAAFHRETDDKVKADLVEIIWQRRLPETLDFLAQVLHHPKPEIWKNALDGIVAIGTAQALIVLEDEKRRLLSISSRDSASRLEWIDEAIEQLSEQ